MWWQKAQCKSPSLQQCNAHCIVPAVITYLPQNEFRFFWVDTFFSHPKSSCGYIMILVEMLLKDYYNSTVLLCYLTLPKYHMKYFKIPIFSNIITEFMLHYAIVCTYYNTALRCYSTTVIITNYLDTVAVGQQIYHPVTMTKSGFAS